MKSPKPIDTPPQGLVESLIQAQPAISFIKSLFDKEWVEGSCLSFKGEPYCIGTERLIASGGIEYSLIFTGLPIPRPPRHVRPYYNEEVFSAVIFNPLLKRVEGPPEHVGLFYFNWGKESGDSFPAITLANPAQGVPLAEKVIEVYLPYKTGILKAVGLFNQLPYNFGSLFRKSFGLDFVK